MQYDERLTTVLTVSTAVVLTNTTNSLVCDRNALPSTASA